MLEGAFSFNYCYDHEDELADRKGISLNLLREKPGAGERQKRAKPIGAWTETVVTLETASMLFGKFSTL